MSLIVFNAMLLLDFQTQSSESKTFSQDRETIEVRLAAGGHLAFSTGPGEIGVSVRTGRVWLTDGPVDHVLPGDLTPGDFTQDRAADGHVCPPRSRVVITALADAVLTIGRHKEKLQETSFLIIDS